MLPEDDVGGGAGDEDNENNAGLGKMMLLSMACAHIWAISKVLMNLDVDNVVDDDDDDGDEESKGNNDDVSIAIHVMTSAGI